MKFLKSHSQSIYLNQKRQKLKRSAKKSRFITFISLSLSILFLLSSVVSLSLTGTLAKADKNEDTLNDSASSFGAKPNDQGSLDESLQKALGNNDRNSFAFVIQRALGIYYLNDTRDASAGNGLPKLDNICSAQYATGAGTLVYHNCDIPNIVTEFTQDIASLVVDSGVKNAKLSQVKLDNPFFGLPSNIPGGEVPVDENARSVKYTALEIFGYNLKYTSYKGEWDHIKVSTKARALSNFGLMDKISLGAKAVGNAVAGGISKGAENFTNKLSQGNLIGAATGFFTGFWEGFRAAGVNTIIDSADLNIHNTKAWYRVGYGSTLYGARELSQNEIAGLMQKILQDIMSTIVREEASVPDDLKKYSSSPSGLEKTSSDDDEDATYESLSDWKSSHQGYIDVANKYNFGCNLDDDESKKKDSVAAFQACWTEKYSAKVEEVKKDAQSKLDDNIINKFLGAIAMADYMAEHPDRNFNAAFNRYVCTNPDGSDVTNADGLPVPAYNENGERDGRCQELRPPIQNGLFGNGYVSDKPAPDTRNSLLDVNFLSLLFPVQDFVEALSDGALSISIILTRASNTVINLTYSPILEAFGIDKIVVNLIEGIRDSLFMPLALLVAAIGALQIFWQQGRRGEYVKGLISIALICVTFISGLALMFAPEKTIKMVDEVPSMIETAIMGTIFQVSGSTSDQMCQATSTGSTTTAEDLEGNKLAYDPSASVRALMCENWRAFAFTPWLYGQWGTSIDNLNAAGTGSKHVSNTNGGLVGDAAINMGGGVVLHNWALYNILMTSSGTSTTEDLSRSPGSFNTNFYRIVDMQAGPNNGEKSDGTYLNIWSGKDYGSRFSTAFLSIFVAAIGAFTVISYSISKILIAFTSTIMLIFLPFAFLMGLHPTIGRSKLKAYLGTILSLMVQRIILTLLLAVMFMFIIAVSNAANGYLLIATVTIGVCLVFIAYKSEILQIVTQTTDGSFGSFGGESVKNPLAALGGMMPKSVKNYAAQTKSRVTGALSGAAAGYISSGSVRTALESAKEASGIQNQRSFMEQRRAGFGIVRSLDQVRQDALKMTRNQLYGQKDLSNSKIDSSRRRVLTSEILQEAVDKSKYGKDLKIPTSGVTTAMMKSQSNMKLVSELGELKNKINDISREIKEKSNAAKKNNPNNFNKDEFMNREDIKELKNNLSKMTEVYDKKMQDLSKYVDKEIKRKVSKEDLISDIEEIKKKAEAQKEKLRRLSK